MKTYGDSFGVLKPLDQVQMPDGRWEHQTLSDGNSARPFALGDLHERLDSWPLSSSVPENVRVQFETAKNLMLYAWFVFEFQTVAEKQAFAALELALRVRFKNPTRPRGKKSKPKPLMLFELLAKAVAEGLIVPEKLPSWEWAQTRREYYARVMGRQSTPFSASRWLEGMRVLIPDLRNFLAHGNVKLDFHNSFAHLEICGDIINQLYPSKQ